MEGADRSVFEAVTRHLPEALVYETTTVAQLFKMNLTANVISFSAVADDAKLRYSADRWVVKLHARLAFGLVKDRHRPYKL